MSATAHETIHGVAAIFDLPRSYVTQIDRRLAEAGIRPSARGKFIPEVSAYSVIMLALAILGDAKPKNAVEVASELFELQDGNGTRLGEALCDLLTERVWLSDEVRLEVDHDLQRATFIDAAENTVRFGNQTPSDRTVRFFGRIDGGGIAALARGLRSNIWERDAA